MAATCTGHHISATLTVDSSQAPPSVCQAVVWPSPGLYREVTVDGAVEHSSGKGQAILRSCALSFLVNVVV